MEESLQMIVKVGNILKLESRVKTMNVEEECVAVSIRCGDKCYKSRTSSKSTVKVCHNLNLTALKGQM